MSRPAAVIKCKELFAVNRKLRAYAEEHNLPANKLLDGCRVALREIAQGRTPVVAQLEAEKVMRA